MECPFCSEEIANTNVCKYDPLTRLLVSETMTGFLFNRVGFAHYLGNKRARWTTAAQTAEFLNGPHRILRSAGSWLDDGFASGGGDDIIIAGTVSNNTVLAGPAITTTSASPRGASPH